MLSDQATISPSRLLTRCVTLVRRNRAILGAYLVAMALFLAITTFAPGFATISHVRFLLLTAAFIGVVALGQTFVILAGGFDLSIPWTLNAVATLTTALCAGHDARLIWVLPLVLCLAIGIGLVNGLGIALLRVPPIIMTLAVNVIAEGVVLLRFSGSSNTSAPPLIVYVVTGVVGPLPIGVWIWTILAAIATLLLTFSGFGRRVYAVGTNPEVSRFAGINVAATRILTYVISAVCAGIAGIMLTGFIGESFLGFGDPFLFASVAAVAVGGASVMGGHGHYLGTVAGAFILTFLTGLLPILNLSQGWLDVIYGVSILVTVALANLSRVAES